MNECIEFLKQFHPKGFWVLTAIKIDKSGIFTSTFTPEDDGACARWIDKYNGKLNIYFSVNQPKKPASSKLNKDQIYSVHYLHVDLDPRIGEDLEEEQARILKLIEAPPEGVPLPTCIIYSGGGYQGFWKLDEPFITNGNKDKVEDIECYNRQLEIDLGGDNTFNVDRIMRLPGTMNIPDEKKKKKGRKEVMAKLVGFYG
jgi:hypothetical protein